MKIYIVDQNVYKDLNLVPEWTDNVWTTEDEIISWHSGFDEYTGFYYNEALDIWETDSENFTWWEELAQARAEVFDYFLKLLNDYYDASDMYDAFQMWFLDRYAEDLEDEKLMFNYVDEFMRESKLKDKDYDTVVD